MKKIVPIFFLAISMFFTAPVFAHAQICTSDGDPCANGGTCRAVPEGPGFYCAPAGTPGVTSPGAGFGNDSSIKGLKSAPGSGGINDAYLKGYANSIISIINGILVPVLIALAFIVFLWGVFKAYIWNQGDETARKQGHHYILWSVVGFVVIFSLWGLVNIVGTTLGLRPGGAAPPTPTINTSR